MQQNMTMIDNRQLAQILDRLIFQLDLLKEDPNGVKPEYLKSLGLQLRIVQLMVKEKPQTIRIVKAA